ncbi:ubiquitin carboxyl-terminal hydrolase 14 [Dorcoceras hygrometricum]|uniref:Ubiquitin carboxyl-terminal hydrolase 14 n=1 Tax=Dorcoceras hygrometricum TaxID=472368 RepID=A0A2Z7ABJ1_9LAMI|nr:ubiquitin carboxyl-terminal hydrolase 14 [Dorcoceras hygrometricum]
MMSKRRGRAGKQVTEDSGAQNQEDDVVQPSVPLRSCCVLISSSNADEDFSRWCISAYPAIASDQLLLLRDLHALRLLVCESAIGSKVTCPSATSFG